MHAREHSSDACMVLPTRDSKSLVFVEVEGGNVTRLSEKPRYEALINTGIYYFKTLPYHPLRAKHVSTFLQL